MVHVHVKLPATVYMKVIKQTQIKFTTGSCKISPREYMLWIDKLPAIQECRKTKSSRKLLVKNSKILLCIMSYNVTENPLE